MDRATTTVIALKELAGNGRPELNTLQQFLFEHMELMTLFWNAVWLCTVGVLIWVVVNEYRNRSD